MNWSGLELKAATAQAASKAVFDVPDMKEIGPHDLCAVVVSDGFPGRDHMWTYSKADDGRWFKFLDLHVSPVSKLFLHSYIMRDVYGS